MTKSIRRHHAARIKANRRSYSGGVHAENPRRLGVLVNAATTCSCWMCGNPRRHTGERTVAERGAFKLFTQLQREGWDG